MEMSDFAPQSRLPLSSHGESGLMRVLDAEVGSHLPERRMLLTPYLS